MDIRVDVVNQRLQTATNLTSFIAGTQEFIRFVFNLDNDWADLLTFAQFTQNGTSYNQYLDEENGAYLPSEIIEGTATLTLYGSYENTIAITDTLVLEIQKNNFVGDGNSTEITLSLYNQLVTEVQSLSRQVDMIDDLVESAVDVAVEEDITARIEDGTMATLTIVDGTIAKTKVDQDFRKTLDTADNFSKVMTGRSYCGTVSESWANISQAGGLLLPGYNTQTDGVIVTFTRLSNTVIVPATDYNIDSVVEVGNILEFPTVTYFEPTDMITVAIYKPVTVVPIIICTQDEYKNMPLHDSNTIFLATTERNFKLYFGDLPISSGGSVGGAVTHILNGTDNGAVAGVAESEEQQ